MTTSDEDFARLWRCNMHRSARDVAAELGITVRGVNKRAKAMGLPAKNIRQSKVEKFRGQLLAAAGAGPGPEPRPAWADDPRIAPVAKEFSDGLVAVQTSEDLARLSTLPFKLAMLLAMHYPQEESTWRELPNLMKQALVCRRIEADMPPSANPAILRQQAAIQMMNEIASVLSTEEQRLLGGMLQVASDRITAQRKEKATGVVAPCAVVLVQATVDCLPVVAGAPW